VIRRCHSRCLSRPSVRSAITDGAQLDPAKGGGWQRWRPAGWQLVIDDAQLFNDKLQEWQDFYNYHRPHGSLGGQTLYERLLQKTITEPAPE
jgi:transposase InsO family protein